VINHSLVHKDGAPFFSVIMNCHNGASFLQEAIESVYMQEFNDWEIIFFDNASTDDSAEIVKSLDTRIKYFYNPVLVPLGSARNKAVKLANGKYLAFLDCDDLWLSGKLRFQFDMINNLLQERKTAVLCYSDAFRIDEVGRDLVQFSHDHELYRGDIYKNLIIDDFIPMSSCVISKEVFENVGGFNVNYEFVEDWDLWLRIARKYDVALVRKPLLKIRLHSNNLSRDMLGHSQEMYNLVDNIITLCAEESRAKSFSLDSIKLRISISRLSVSIKERKGLFMSITKLILQFISSPYIFFKTTKKYINKKMIKVVYMRIFG